jgi:hypothetical protein
MKVLVFLTAFLVLILEFYEFSLLFMRIVDNEASGVSG